MIIDYKVLFFWNVKIFSMEIKKKSLRVFEERWDFSVRVWEYRIVRRLWEMLVLTFSVLVKVECFFLVPEKCRTDISFLKTIFLTILRSFVCNCSYWLIEGNTDHNQPITAEFPKQRDSEKSHGTNPLP